MTLLILYGLLSGLAGGLFYRIRGGFLPTGSTQLARLIWCIPVAAAFTLTFGWLVGGLTLIVTFLGLMIPHGRDMDMGTSNGTFSDDFYGLMCIGVVRLLMMLTPAIALASISPFWCFLGILHPVAYWIGWKLPIPRNWVNNPYALVDGFTAWGELFWGFVQGIIIFLILI